MLRLLSTLVIGLTRSIVTAIVAQCSSARSKAYGSEYLSSAKVSSTHNCWQNVTYGYTSATYSGRMPCIEVADSIVQTGRETLEKVCRPSVSSGKG
jgi:DNA polymerase elongation subunit (family B)